MFLLSKGRPWLRVRMVQSEWSADVDVTHFSVPAGLGAFLAGVAEFVTVCLT
jgi:hypothetical protein